MGIKKALIDAGIITITEPAKTAPPTGPKVATIPESAPATVRGSGTTVDVDQEILQNLQDVVNNAASPQLQTFQAVLATLADEALPEKTKYTTAFTAATASGKFKAADLVTGIAMQQQALDAEAASFSKQASKAKKDIDLARTSIDSIEQQISSLQQQITELEKKKQETLIEASEQEQHLAQRQAAFNATLLTVTSQLSQSQSKISSYLVPASPERKTR
jgi:predicted  nucleic acid-binding Zn-ribbon protein